MAKKTELTCTYETTRWSAADGDYTVGYCEDGVCVCGPAGEGELLQGVPYLFYGRWHDHPKHGRQFRFTHFMRREPHSRRGVVAYLKKHACNVGPAIAGRLHDAFGGDAVKVLRTEPERAAESIKGLTAERAAAAARELEKLVELEDTKIELAMLFEGRGFPGKLIDAVLAKWAVAAPVRIKRDPFTLLVHKMPGCGFARCDRLYLDLGLAAEKLKRQVCCLWHVLHEDMSGSTWLPVDHCVRRLSEHVSVARVDGRKAVLCGVRAGWLAIRTDEDGRRWLADGKHAAAETRLAERILELTAETADAASLVTCAETC